MREDIREVPGPLNYHQPVTRWVLEAAGLQQITMGVAGSRVE
jgi:hypothetical protein